MSCADADSDGLTNGDEWKLGTDGGGEADSSEVEREGYIPVVVEVARVNAGQITELDTVVLERALPLYLPVIVR